MKRVLLVEDDDNMSFMITDGLEAEGFEVLSFQEGAKALDAILDYVPDIVLMDVNLKGALDGFGTAKRIRTSNTYLPILFITSRNQIEDLKQGFSIGNMDYLKKPFGMGELVLRINELLMKNQLKSENLDESDVIYLGRYSFYPSKFCLHIDKEEITLRKSECRVLLMLCQNINNVVNKIDILHHIWDTTDPKSKEASLDNVLHVLRIKLSQDQSIALNTIPRVGYMLKV